MIFLNGIEKTFVQNTPRESVKKAGSIWTSGKKEKNIQNAVF